MIDIDSNANKQEIAIDTAVFSLNIIGMVFISLLSIFMSLMSNGIVIAIIKKNLDKNLVPHYLVCHLL